MSDIRELENREQHPTHNEIQKRAYELYLARGCADGQDIQDWHFAEQQLRNEYQHGERVGIKTASFVAGPGGVAKTDTPFENDFIIAEEERRQVRATEQIKKERESSTAPRAKTAS
jgi:hypothetical protein